MEVIIENGLYKKLDYILMKFKFWIFMVLNWNNLLNTNIILIFNSLFKLKLINFEDINSNLIEILKIIFKMVLIHYKKSDTNQFLFETTAGVEIATLID